ncbi:extracellular solute-binding protein [Fodinicola acaciae]|uniref:ABC transporter substrate-binding protein n=1 Tax=Fodinicola acaciae TaxID=2681555 RepID=UPI0013D688CD|nr:extracellular solute-binding protein [Fodinicola acaciae]
MARTRVRRLTVLGAVLSAAVLLLTGCIGGQVAGSGGNGEKYAGEIEWWTINLQKNYSAYINGLIGTYQAAHPDVKIRWVDVPGQDITTKLLAAIAGDKVPDAVNFTSNTTGLFAGNMADLGQFFSAKDLSAYASALSRPLKDRAGKQIAIPWYNGGAGLGVYRKSALAKTGFDPAKPPKTWDDALALAQRVKDSGGGYGTNAMAYSYTMQSEGVPLISPDRKKAAFNTPQAAAILAKFKKYLDSGAIAPGVLGKDPRSYAQNLSNKLITFMPTDTSSNLVGLQKNSPDVYADSVVEPAVTGPSGVQLMNSQQVFGIPAGSQHKAAAAEWLKFVTSPANQLAFCKIVAIYPSTVDTLKDPYFTDITGNTPADQGRRVLVQTFPKIVDASLGSGNDENLRNIFDEQVRAYMTGSKTAVQALNDAAQQWNTELAKAS